MNRSSSNEVKVVFKRDLLLTVWSERWIILVITLIAFNVSIIHTLHDDPVYRAQSTLHINSSEHRLPPDILYTREHNVNNEIVILRSKHIAHHVAEVLMAQPHPGDEQGTVIPLLVNTNEAGEIISKASIDEVSRRIESAIEINRLADSDIIEITAQRPDPGEAALLANTYAQVYYNKHLTDSREQLREMREFLELQLNEKAEKLRNAEERFRSYMEHHGVVIVDEESRMIIEQMAHLEALNNEVTIDIHKAESGLALLENQLAEQGSEVVKGITSSHDPYIQRIQEQIAELELQRDLTVTQNPQFMHDERYRNRLQGLEEQLSVLRNTLQNTTEEYVRSLTPGDEEFLQLLKQRIAEEQIELQGLRIQQAANLSLLQQYETQLENLPGVNLEFARLERAKQSAEQLYLMVEEKYNEMVIAEQSTMRT